MRSAAKIAILVSQSGEAGTFVPVMPEEVPEWLKTEDEMGRLVAGNMASRDGGPWYAALKLADSPLVIEQPRLGVKRQ